MNIDDAANLLKELGHPTRLRVYKQLVKSGKEGTPVGKLQEKLGVPNSTLSHHLSALISVGLIRQHRVSRMLYCIPEYDLLNELMIFLTDECCVDEK
ncbi:ArsR/SmtB family transcription factor [Hafnia paralvei]|uniref:ArsR/SmtB family transcription factor n=1 Tax=Hafnia paralvei TaxID=546367 RepID=UPI0020323BCE|nr:metalloregulator ArsR/SmtB family transcription factor [Hafnia paralvei]